MRNGEKPIAVKSLEGAARGPKPLFSGRSRNLRAACHFVRCNELWCLKAVPEQTGLDCNGEDLTGRSNGYS